jgi:hypothetical protein
MVMLSEQFYVEVGKQKVPIVVDEEAENAKDGIEIDTKEIAQHISKLRDDEVSRFLIM